MIYIYSIVFTCIAQYVHALYVLYGLYTYCMVCSQHLHVLYSLYMCLIVRICIVWEGVGRRHKVSIAPVRKTCRPSFRKVDVRLPEKENSNSHGARPIHLIITMIQWIRTSRLSMKDSHSAALPPDVGSKVTDLRARAALFGCRANIYIYTHV
jgi:hypothetical protein